MIPLQLKRDKIVFSVLQMPLPLRIRSEELRELARISNLLDVLNGIDTLLGTAADTDINRTTKHPSADHFLQSAPDIISPLYSRK